MLSNELASGTNKRPIPSLSLEIEGEGKVDRIEAFIATTPTHLAGTIGRPPIFPSSLADFLALSFLPLLPESESIKGVYWAHEESTVRIWTVIDEPNDVLEEQIYKAQLRFMDSHVHLYWDFSVIYRFGKSMQTIIPTDAIKVETVECRAKKSI